MNVRLSRRSGNLKLAPPPRTANVEPSKTSLSPLFLPPPVASHYFSLALNDSHDIFFLSFSLTRSLSLVLSVPLFSIVRYPLFPTCRPPDALFYDQRRSLLSTDDLFIHPHKPDPFSNCSSARTCYRVCSLVTVSLSLLRCFPPSSSSVKQATRVMDRCARCTQVRISRASSLVSLHTRTDRRDVTMLSKLDTFDNRGQSKKNGQLARIGFKFF